MSSSRAPKDGVGKRGKGKQIGGKDSSIELMEQAANNGTLPPGKVALAAAQASISDAGGNHEQDTDVDHQGSTSRQVPNDSRETSLLPNDAAQVTPVKGDNVSDVDMSDVSSEPENLTETPSRGDGQQDVASTLHRQRDDSPQDHSDDASQDDECLGRLDPPSGSPPGRSSNSPRINDDVIDGWGTFRGSTFVIIQCGPRHAAKYRLEYRPNYEDDKTDNISDQEVRISSLRDKDSSGKKHWRYSRDNVDGIYGVVSEERNPYKNYKTDPCLWVKIKWKGLEPRDQERLVRGCSWIPRSEFTRFCGGKRATERKLKEVWDKQEARYLESRRGEPRMANEDRSPTPCPLGASSNGDRDRRSTSRLQTPENRPEDPGRHQTRTPSRRSVPRSSQVNQTDSNGSSNSEGLSPSRAATAAPSSHVQRVTNESGAQSQESRFVQTWEEFVAEMAQEEHWQELDENERMTKRAMAKGSYHVYCETVAKTRGASPTERGPVTGAPQIPVH
ncbi:hypothetical protein PENSUB_4613 [Penicillium subrubescens]|uniref:Uncharacterized protein n=1 Tax=Penicillium subrubescens TaxID=1316194 RepID=A0A1Q5UC04_9EURO|nr:hypothetical protein PENSUB_4613 [Penicillium subrubescens]